MSDAKICLSPQLSARYTRVTVENRNEYAKLALNFRLHEFDAAVAALRDGMARVVPVPLLSLFTGRVKSIALQGSCTTRLPK